MDVKSRLERFDDAQQQRPKLAIPLATVKKFGEDKSTNLASMMAFWAFFSIFPLFLAGVTLLSWFVPEQDRVRVLGQVATYFPLLDVSTIGALSGSVLALVVGLGSAFWSGSAVVRVTQDAFNTVWEVPRIERPKLGEQLKRSILVMSTIGVGLLASTLTIGFVSGDNPSVDLGPLSLLLGYGLAIAFDIGLFIAAFRLLTDRQISTRDVVPGAVFAGVAFWILQSISSIIITRHLSGAQETYGNFATVITIMWWFYLQSQLTLLGAQVNVVLKRRYWPRSLLGGPETEADHRLLRDFARERTHAEGEHVSVRVDDPDSATEGSAAQGRAAEKDPVAPRDLTVAELVQAASEQTSRLVRAEIKKAGVEMQDKGRHAAKGAGLIGVAGVVALFGLGALIAGIILLLALAIGAWATAGIVAAALLAGAVVLALAGKKHVKQVGPILPEQAAAELRADIAVFKERIHR